MALVAAAISYFGPGTTPPAPVYHVNVDIPPDQELVLQGSSSIVLSPDGNDLVYAARSVGGVRLYRRSLAHQEATPIQGTDGAESPFFSPDGEWVGFFSDGVLRKVLLTGGVSQVICEVPATVLSGSWGVDDLVIFSADPRSGLHRVHADGGTPEVLTTSDNRRGEFGHRWAQLLPGGEHVLFDAWTGAGDRAALLSLTTGDWRHVEELGEARRARYLPSGHLVYVEPQSGTLMAAPYRVGNQIMAVRVTTEPTFAAETPHVLFETPYTVTTTHAHYDVSNRRQFVMRWQDVPVAPSQIHVVLNWFEELKRLAPTDN